MKPTRSTSLALLLCMALSLIPGLGCLQYFEGEVQGFIRDAVTKEGINRATVKIYFDEEDESSYQLTYTQTNGDPGYFVFRRIVWATEEPFFGDEGDLQDVRIVVEHEDYQSFDATIRIVSGASSSVGDLYLDRAFFESGQVDGYVYDREEDEDGENPGINGLTVKLYVPDLELSTDAEALQEEAEEWVATHDADYVATTQTQDGDPGYYSFEDVRWKDPNQLPEGGEDEHGTPWKVIIEVEDADHFDLLEPDLTLYSGEVGCTVDDLYIDKKEYEGSLEGYVTDISTGDGINGITVDVYVPEEDLGSEEALQAFVDDNDPDATGRTQVDEDEEDGYFLINNIRWELDEPPDPEDAHQRKEVIVVADGNAYREEILFADPAQQGFQPLVVLTSTKTVTMPDIQLSRTDFTGSLEAYVRRTAGDEDSGENGVEVSVYYDEDDPDLLELEDFDPDDAEFDDRTTTGNNEVGDDVYEGYFRFDNLGWNRDEGGSLANGRDELTVILYSKGIDFSGFEGNTDPRWQKFKVISALEDPDSDEDEVTTLPDLKYRPTEFTASLDGYVRHVLDDELSGKNGIQIQLYYDENDPDLSELESFDPDEIDFEDEVNTRSNTVGEDTFAGYYAFNGLFWRNPDGPSVGSDRDRLTLILYSEDVDFSSFEGNEDPHWLRFTILSGDDVNTLPDLLYAPTEFSAKLDGYVRKVVNDSSTGVNGVDLFLYYDQDDPDLSELGTFDPEFADFDDRTSTTTIEIGDQNYAGYFELEDLFWENPEGASLSNGRDQLTIILYSEQVDFSSFTGNEDPSWQRFTIVSGDDGNTIPDLLYIPPAEPFSASCESYVLATPEESGTGKNGVTLKLYYDPEDPDLAELSSFDPSTATFSDQTSTANQVLADEVYPGYFIFENLEWERAGGGTLSNGRDTVTIILYSTQVDFSGMEGNEDPSWQRFTLVSGDSVNVLPDLTYAP